MRTYEEVIDYLYQSLPMFQRVGAVAYKKDLGNTLALCEALGNPQRQFKTIHIAGTNGKGSTSHIMAAILQCAGYKTGLYTSPHLKEFTERIRINGIEASREFVVDFVGRIQPALEEIKPSFFEMTVAMAFDNFASLGVDVAVIEVGVGGRLDSTNVIDPDLSIITNISFDHQDLLGDTLKKIAGEKAGIIKEGRPVVISERQLEVEEVFKVKAANMQSRIVFAQDVVRITSAVKGFDLYADGKVLMGAVQPDLRGSYQEQNLHGIVASVVELRSLGYTISDDALRKGIENASRLTGLKGRWQQLGERPLMICDTGHNEAGIREVLKQIRATPHRKLHMVIGVVKEKEHDRVLSQLPKDAQYYFCQANIPRALDAARLAAEASMHGLQGEVVRDVNAAIRRARASAGSDDMIFIGGSTFIVAEVEGL